MSDPVQNLRKSCKFWGSSISRTSLFKYWLRTFSSDDISSWNFMALSTFFGVGSSSEYKTDRSSWTRGVAFRTLKKESAINIGFWTNSSCATSLKIRVIFSELKACFTSYCSNASNSSSLSTASKSLRACFYTFLSITETNLRKKWMRSDSVKHQKLLVAWKTLLVNSLLNVTHSDYGRDGIPLYFCHIVA